ncbi:MAG: methyltransferase domain-containing protein [Ferruginibacter sp.]
MHINQNHKFIEPYDDLARLINDKANQLYEKLLLLDISDTAIDDFGKYYFNNHHTGSRLFFSIQSSADIIYRSVKKTGKDISAVSFIDYGAGLGTLFLLAGTAGFKQVYFNDYFPQWADYAKIICSKLDITLTGFISGDIDAVIDHGKKNDVYFDIVASRNVVEHIYDLRSFYSKLYQSNLTTVCYATTTANYHNIAMRLKHYWYHNKAEKTTYQKQREEYIKELMPAASSNDLLQLVKLTRGRAFKDFTNAIDMYFLKKPLPPVEFLGTNTCDCKTGVWAEHLITKKNYDDIIQNAGFTMEYTAGFWDTNYKYVFVNLITRLLNRIIIISGKKGYWFAPFVNIVAGKK